MTKKIIPRLDLASSIARGIHDTPAVSFKIAAPNLVDSNPKVRSCFLSFHFPIPTIHSQSHRDVKPFVGVEFNEFELCGKVVSLMLEVPLFKIEIGFCHREGRFNGSSPGVTGGSYSESSCCCASACPFVSAIGSENTKHKKFKMELADRAVGFLLSFISLSIFTYYTFWVIILPFVDDDHFVHKYFLPQEYAILIPVSAGVALLCFLSMFIGFVMLKSKKKKA
ncbi:hypothetical protein VNO78_26957 [Psophocarpus tetragonolobus]|uniref:Dolichol phosphate-mannose biosynthesis regulatory protein n=1 Tax=Psophocarpus tetragonolobus TaxID=3891 RepID=A0AAN9X973_PSOTE